MPFVALICYCFCVGFGLGRKNCVSIEPCLIGFCWVPMEGKENAINQKYCDFLCAQNAFFKDVNNLILMHHGSGAFYLNLKKTFGASLYQ